MVLYPTTALPLWLQGNDGVKIDEYWAPFIGKYYLILLPSFVLNFLLPWLHYTDPISHYGESSSSNRPSSWKSALFLKLLLQSLWVDITFKRVESCLLVGGGRNEIVLISGFKFTPEITSTSLFVHRNSKRSRHRVPLSSQSTLSGDGQKLLGRETNKNPKGSHSSWIRNFLISALDPLS